MALGRLGSCEFDLLSDADLLFVCDESTDRDKMRQLAEQTMHALTLYTRDGAIFAVDTRLRPHGYEGELVVTPAQLSTYFAGDAKPWEALTYLRLRYVAGDADLAASVVDLVREKLPAMARDPAFGDDLEVVRMRLAKSDLRPNLKTAEGGTYDIDYIVGKLQVRHSLWSPANLRDRVAVVHAAGFLETSDATALQQNARILRSIERAIRLATGQTLKWIPAADHARRSILHLLAGLVAEKESPELLLTRVLQQNREIYRKYQGRDGASGSLR